MYRYVIVEYCFEDDKTYAEGKVIGSFEDMKTARKEVGEYIKRNVKRKKAKYRHWHVEVRKERIYFPIREI